MKHRNCLGFSLTEFTIALVVVGVSALLMAPLYYKTVNNYRATRYTNELVATLIYARSQAVKRGQTVSICSSDNGARCTATAGELGFIVFVDNNAGGTIANRNVILKQWSVRSSSVTISFNTFIRKRYISFGQMGNVVAQADVTHDSAANRLGAFTHWINRFSPISLAHAEERADIPSVSRSANDPSVQGTFTVCAGHIGRIVKISMLGQIKTSETRCQ